MKTFSGQHSGFNNRGRISSEYAVSKLRAMNSKGRWRYERDGGGVGATHWAWKTVTDRREPESIGRVKAMEELDPDNICWNGCCNPSDEAREAREPPADKESHSGHE